MNDTAVAPRIFLVVIDETEEMRVALQFAARRAAHTGGRVALLHVVEPSDLKEWISVETLVREERREEAERLVEKLSAEVKDISGAMPVVHIREGRLSDELLALIDEEPSISILVLAAGTGPEGPGPLTSYLTGKPAARLRVPITIVPGGLSLDQIDALT
jgi:nucleotide-binding universal stress UspA family protein